MSKRDTITPLLGGAATYKEMLRDIGRAKQSILFANFCFREGKAMHMFGQALKQAAARGAKVYILADHYGSSDITKKTVHELKQAGVLWVWFRPFSLRAPWRYNLRLHKKILIVDGEIGYTGGVGVADFWLEPALQYPAPWRDTHFRITGLAVDKMTRSFAESWQLFSNTKLAISLSAKNSSAQNDILQVVSSKPGRARHTKAGLSYVELINRAKVAINITTAYFGPNQALTRALLGAAKRNVHIRLLVNGPHASHKIAHIAGRSQYAQLLRHGIEIYEYQPTKLHAKITTIDGELSSIGSANMNFRSFHHDEELNLVVRNTYLTKRLDDQFDSDLCEAKKINLESWEERPLFIKVAQIISSTGRYFF